MRHFGWFVLLGAVGSLAGAARADTSLREAVKKDYDATLRALFTHFHQNPELSFQEEKTSARFASELSSLGYEVTTGVGGFGVVAVLKNGAGPTVMLRADMDGLPVEERSGLAHASKARQKDRAGVDQPVMHACGHDTHMTAMVGAARQLAARRADWSGTLVIIGQPAEEILGGARAMLEDGLYTRFPKPNYAVAFHVAADKPAGKVIVPPSVAYSGSDSVELIVHGVSAHGAAPHKGVDPIVVSSQIVMGLQTLVSRTRSPLKNGVITVGSIHGGVRHNIIPDSVTMLLTVRSEDEATRKLLLDGIDRVARGTAQAMNVPADKMPEVKRPPDAVTPPTLNDPETALRLKAALTKALGPDRMSDLPRDTMGAEDFAYFVAPDSGVKGVYFSVGGTPEGEIESAPSHHSGLFKVVPEPVITSGAEALAVSAMTLMPKAGASQ